MTDDGWIPLCGGYVNTAMRQGRTVRRCTSCCGTWRPAAGTEPFASFERGGVAQALKDDLAYARTAL